MSFKTEAMVHSINAIKEVEIIEKRGDNDYLAKVGDVVCTAIFNPFVGLYYVDDVYGVVKSNDRARDERIR